MGVGKQVFRIINQFRGRMPKYSRNADPGSFNVNLLCFVVRIAIRKYNKFNVFLGGEFLAATIFMLQKTPFPFN